MSKRKASKQTKMIAPESEALVDCDGKRLQLGSKVRVLDRDANSLGVPQSGFIGLITRIIVDSKGTLLYVKARRFNFERAARPNMVSRRRYRSEKDRERLYKARNKNK